MYKLKIRLENCGDFYHECTLIDSDNPEVNIYYTTREPAAVKLRTFYSTLVDTIIMTKEYMFDKIDVIKKFEEYLYLLIDKFDTFNVRFVLGSVDLEMKLCKINPEVIAGGGTIFREENPILVLYPTYNFINEYNWDAVRECSSIIEG